MENQTSQPAAADFSASSKTCCSNECSSGPNMGSDHKNFHDENCKHCCGGKHGHRAQLITVGVAATTGFLLGWLLKGHK